MAKRKKRIEKQIKGLEKQKKEHRDKLKFEKGRLDTTPEYWQKEIKGFSEQIEEKKEKLEKLNKSKRIKSQIKSSEKNIKKGKIRGF